MNNPVSPDKLLRHWLVSLPGMVEAATPQEVVALSYRAAGAREHCSVDEWTAALKRAGFLAVPVGQKFRLQFPGPNPGVVGRPYNG